MPIDSLLIPYLESILAGVVGLAAFLFGRWCSRLPKPFWMIGYILPLGLLVLYCLAIFNPVLTSIPPLSWMLIGRIRFVCFNFVTTMVLSAPLSRLPQRRTRVVIGIFIVVLTCVSIVPFLAPAFNRNYLAHLKTRLDADGVCRQSSPYTCGPAAAVTALRKLGFPAEEGRIAILAHTSSLAGTEPDVLARTLQRQYGNQGLVVQYRSFRDLDDLKTAGLTVAVVKFNAMQDHCVTVLEVKTNGVMVADPLSGLGLLGNEEFENKWQFVGIVLKRIQPAPMQP